jgi:hypothetical protein
MIVLSNLLIFIYTSKIFGFQAKTLSVRWAGLNWIFDFLVSVQLNDGGIFWHTDQFYQRECWRFKYNLGRIEWEFPLWPNTANDWTPNTFKNWTYLCLIYERLNQDDDHLKTGPKIKFLLRLLLGMIRSSLGDHSKTEPIFFYKPRQFYIKINIFFNFRI